MWLILAEALEYVEAWRQATSDNPAGICGPIGPTEQLPLVARLVNELGLSLKHAHFWGMDEWYANGREVPTSHPLSFERADRELCFNRIRPEFAIPDANQTFREITFNVVSQRVETEIRPRVFYQDFPGWVLYVSVFNLLVGNALMVYLSMMGAFKRRAYRLVPWAILNPVYWLMHSIASYKALWQLVVRPHYWEKTTHGLSTVGRGSAETGEPDSDASVAG